MNTDPMMKPAGQLDPDSAPLFSPPAATPAIVPGPTPAPVKCEKCDVPIYFVRNRKTTRTGPVDSRAAIYVVDLAATGTDAKGDPLFEGWTKKDFLEQAAYVQMKDGRQIPAALIDFGVNHYATCTSPEFFSKNGGYRKPGPQHKQGRK